MLKSLSAVFLLLLALNSMANADLAINKVHLDNDISCADCHGTATPEKRASAKACLNCHEQIPGSIKTYTDAGNERSVNVHDSHDGQLRCTLCHHIHKPSTLYCADCHQFEVQVP